MQNLQNMQNVQNVQNMQNMHNIDMQKSKICESESSINSRTCLGHLVFFFFCLAPKQKNAAPCIPGAQHTSTLALATRFWATSPPLHAFHQIAHWLAPSQVNHNDEEYFFLLLRKIPTQNSYWLWKWCVASNDWCQILVRYKVIQPRLFQYWTCTRGDSCLHGRRWRAYLSHKGRSAAQRKVEALPWNIGLGT